MVCSEWCAVRGTSMPQRGGEARQVHATARVTCGQERGVYMNRESNQNLSGNEIYHTSCSLLVILKKSRSKFHCKKGFNSILFSYKSVSPPRRTESGALHAVQGASMPQRGGEARHVHTSARVTRGKDRDRSLLTTYWSESTDN